MLSPLHKQLLNNYQQDFPLTATPYQTIAEQLGVSEAEVLSAFQSLSQQNYISRIGPVIAPNAIGASALVAMAIPEADLQRVADLISAYPNVNHNYERENRFNLWFVLMADDVAQLATLISEIEQQTGYAAMLLPMLADYYINLGFELNLND
ncbi:MAG: Lrp/AsnC family transcriptional regulator [Methylomonas sp.]